MDSRLAVSERNSIFEKYMNIFGAAIVENSFFSEKKIINLLYELLNLGTHYNEVGFFAVSCVPFFAKFLVTNRVN